MITVRESGQRGHTQIGWLDGFHTFSFGDYSDPAHHHFRHLRVINEDRIQPAQGFDTHSHRDMEIITYVLEGELEHRDSMGHHSVIRPHEVQRMSAGTGVSHSEFNASKSEPVHLLQIWILPAKKGLKPGYEQKSFPPHEKQNQLRLVASQDGRNGSVTIHQEADLYASTLEQGQSCAHRFLKNRHGWLQVVRGRIALNGIKLNAGDGAQISNDPEIFLHAKNLSEILLFDLS